jgi:hypothetical protein
MVNCLSWSVIEKEERRKEGKKFKKLKKGKNERMKE